MESVRQLRERNLISLTQKVSVEDALMLQKISHRLHQLDEHACNWGLSSRQLNRVDRLEAEAQSIATKHNFTAYHQSDPRGWSLYLVPPELNIDSQYDQGLGVCPH